jgi:hypothetical protein
MGLMSMQKTRRDSPLFSGLLLMARCRIEATPFFFAAQNGHLPLVDLLILCGAIIHLANIQGVAPLMIAA